jgi:pseudouridine kinase
MTNQVVVVGGANMDVKARSHAPAVPRTSNPGVVRTTPGGVGRNVAENLARLGSAVTLVAAVGTDVLGDDLLAETASAGVDISLVRRGAHSTGTYVAVLDADGELVTAVADMAATTALSPADMDDVAEVIRGADLVVLDGNLSAETLGRALDLCAAAGVRVVLDPVSVPKAATLFGELRADRPLLAVTPNSDELESLGGTPSALHGRGAELVWVRLGARGSLLGGPDGEVAIEPVPATEVVDVTGAGDAMLAAFCHALLGGATPADAAAYGHAAAALTVASPHTVRPDLTDELVRSLL